jgi:hypothetical protein
VIVPVLVKTMIILEIDEDDHHDQNRDKADDDGIHGVEDPAK